ncbi:MAG: transporter substrate-binding domain-containing protein [Chlamydiota bacterium]
MHTLRAIFLFVLSIFILHGCSCGSSHHRAAWRIGIDPAWYPIDFGRQQPFVNGFTEDLLLEMAQNNGIEFERISANWDTLFDGLKMKKYEGILSSLPPYDFNMAKYDFSHNFLELGPVLIIPTGEEASDLSKMSGQLVGLVTGDPAVLILQKYPDIILRNYPSIPDLLNAVERGEIDGALLDRIPAVAYVRDLYAGKLKIGSAPLNEAGLHLISLKGKNEHLVNLFNRSLDQMQKKKTLQSLLKKWHLEN